MKNIILVFLILLIGNSTNLLAMNYSVGSGDVLAITVFDNDKLGATVRVSDNGSITLPLLNDIDVKGKSVGEIAKQIEALFADGYLVNPQVNVFIKEYRSRKVVILGQVGSPGLYELSGNTTILELISKAGGLSNNAGPTAIIKRKGEDGKGEKLTLDLKGLVEDGDTSLNIPIIDGDSVHISKAGEFYVTGEVRRPDSYKYEAGLTILKAVTMAGGFTDLAALKKIRIIRKNEGKEQVVNNIKLDETIELGDVVVVPESFF